jgi:tripartite ATP-independent transporter DctM subunit
MELLLIFVSFFSLLLLGIPIAFVIGIVSLGYLVIVGSIPLELLPQRIFMGIDKYPLMAVPFFVLAAELMIEIKILKQLVNLAHALVGHLKGGLAQVNVVGSVFFAGISGSALADAGGLGPLEIAMMTEKGYPRAYSAAVTAASAVLGPIIPPSITVVIYALVAQNVSVTALLMAGFVPGFIIAIALMVLNYFIAIKKGYPAAAKRASLRELLLAIWSALLPLLMPAILLGGMLLGIFTPTEAAAVACAYALFLGFFVLRTLKLRTLPAVFIRAGLTTGSVFFIMATCNVLTWILASLNLAPMMETLFKSISSNPYVFLFLINILFLILGCLLETTAAIIIFTPFLAPLAASLGINPIHFGIVVIVNLMIGLITPPVGLVLYVTCNVARITLEELIREVWPFVVVEIVALGIITYWPAATLSIPRLFGLIQ